MGMELLSATASSGVSGAREIATSQNVHITPPIRFPIEEAVEQKAEVGISKLCEQLFLYALRDVMDDSAKTN
jgi:hypothetical protein